MFELIEPAALVELAACTQVILGAIDLQVVTIAGKRGAVMSIVSPVLEHAQHFANRHIDRGELGGINQNGHRVAKTNTFQFWI